MRLSGCIFEQVVNNILGILKR